MMPEIVIRLLATLAILCQLAPLGDGAGLTVGGEPELVARILPQSLRDSSTARPPQAEGPLARTDLPEGAITERKHTGEAETDTERLACAIYNEAGGDMCSDECRRDVGDVILNRVEDSRFPDSIEAVLTAPLQYGNFAKTGIVWPERARNPLEAEAVERAWRIAEELMAGEHGELFGQGYVWQAEFTQGSDGFWLDGIYFGR